MASSLSSSFFFFFFHLLFFANPSSSSTDTFVYGGCSQLKYTPGSNFQNNLNTLLASIDSSATSLAYNNITVPSPGGNGADRVYGLYQCRGDVGPSTCADCVLHAVGQLGLLCLDATGGTIQLEGCYVKYDKATIIGVQDKSLVMKRCGPQSKYDMGLDDRRDEVLEGLEAGGGTYRVAMAAYVKGMAQCVGDLSAGECTDCVTQAGQTLRGVCSGSEWAEAYLGKCYARYGMGGGYSKGSDNDSNDEAQKTWAITVGIIAGVVFLIVFIAVLRKAYRTKDALFRMIFSGVFKKEMERLGLVGKKVELQPRKDEAKGIDSTGTALLLPLNKVCDGNCV